MTREQLLVLEDKECAIAHDLASKARKLYETDPNVTISQIGEIIYDIHDVQSYVESGCLGKIISLTGKTIIIIYPCKDEATFEQLYGYSIAKLVDLCAAGHIVPIIQRPTKYEGLDFFDPLLALKPVSYFLRGALIYAVIFGDNFDFILNRPYRDRCDKIDYYYHKGLEHKVIKSAKKYPESWQPYLQEQTHHSKSKRDEYLVDSSAYMYAQACCFLPPEVVDWFLEKLDKDSMTKEALCLLTHLHMKLDHPIQQGLFKTQHHDSLSQYYQKYCGLTTNVFCKLEKRMEMRDSLIKGVLSITTPVFPSASDLDKIRSSDISELMAITPPKNLGEIDLLKQTIEDQWRYASQKIDGINLKARKIKTTLSVASFLSSGLVALNVNPLLGIAGMVGALKIPEPVINVVTEHLEGRIRDKLITLLWQMGRNNDND